MKPTIAVCDCDPDGSLVGTVCKAFGGQCVCLPGVRGRQCDECRPGTYDLSPSGCTGMAIGVHYILETLYYRHFGSHVCYMHRCVQIHACTQAHTQTHVRTHVCMHMPTGTQYTHIHTRMFLCAACSCDPVGSVSELCDPELGRCECLPNVAGPNCSTCEPNFWGVTDDRGCTPCSCNEIGTQVNVSSKVYTLMFEFV